MAITCMIVDDIPDAVEMLTTFVEDTPDFTLVFATRNPLEALQYLQKNTIDVVFLDINMPKLGGLELLKLTKGRSKFVFTTAHPEYALDGFELGVIDYLVKPLTFERFLGAVQKIRALFPQSEGAVPVTIAAPTPTLPPVDDYILVKSEHKGKIVKIALADIKYIESMKNQLFIHAHPDRRIVTMLGIKDIEGHLPASQFVRVHRSYVIAIKEIISVEGNMIKTHTGTIPIGISHREAFFESIKHKIISKKTDSETDT